MAKEKKVVKRISESTAGRLLGDLKTMSLAAVGKKHGIENFKTIPKMVHRAYERAGSKIPRQLGRLYRGSAKGSAQKPAQGPAKGPVVKVGKKGTIIIPKNAIVDTYGFRQGQKFTARRHGKKIVLTLS